MNHALQYALKLLGKKDYSEAELVGKFKLKQFDAAESDAALLFLKEKSFIDDRRYVSQFIRSHPSRGVIRLKFELLKKGVSEEIISELLSGNDQDSQLESAREVAAAWIRKKQDKHEDKYKLKQNLIAKLSRQGYPYELICQAIKGLME